MDRDDNNQERGRRIRNLREKWGLSQSSLASALHVSQGRVSQIEKGAAIPNSMLYSLCVFFRVDESYLLSGKFDFEEDHKTLFLDSEKYYRKAVNKMLHDYRYRKVKSPVSCCTPNIDLPKGSKAFKSISKVLGDCDCTYALTVPEIYTRFGNLQYPSITYTFAIRCMYCGSGYIFEAFETDRKYETEPPELEDRPFEDEKLLYYSRVRRTLGDNVSFQPYHFRMFSPLDCIEKYEDPKHPDEPYFLLPGELEDFMVASDCALFNGEPAIENPDDMDSIRKYCPERYEFDDDMDIDRVEEFERFKAYIRRGVGYKSLDTHTTRAVGGFSNPKSIIFQGNEHYLNSKGRIEIQRDDSGISFIIDDRIVTGEQFMELLGNFEGNIMEYDMKGL